MKLNELTPEQIKSGPVPLDDLLKDSVYYPACCTDGRPVKLCNTVWRHLGVNSYVYCDFNLSEAAFLRDTRTMRGYHVIAHRHLEPAEYIPGGWQLEMAPPRGNGRTGGYWDSFLGGGGPRHCACWAVFERDAWKGPEHGPERLSVLFVCGEGLATFQQLYCARRIAPKMVCFIQCWGFAGNWTDFSAAGAPFHRTLLKYRESIPQWLCIGDCTGIHGVLRLRGLDGLGIRLCDYTTPGLLEKRFGTEPEVMGPGHGHQVLIYTRGSRRYAAVNISYHMPYALYDITDSRYGMEELIDRLILVENSRPAYLDRPGCGRPLPDSSRETLQKNNASGVRITEKGSNIWYE